MSSSSLASKRGVIYFSSLPPNLSPHEIRLHFNKFGAIRRMKFVPYPKKERRPGGPLLPLRYKEGWMEFERAEDGEAAATHMNTSPVDCKRRRKCYGQLWTVKYLEDFEWSDLAEEREDARRMRRASVVAARRDEYDMNEQYRRLVAARSSARRAREQRAEGDASEGEAEKEQETDDVARPARRRRLEEESVAVVPTDEEKTKKENKQTKTTKSALRPKKKNIKKA